MSAGMAAALVGGGVALCAGLLLVIIAVLGRRARAGRLAGRYTSRRGNSSDNSSSSTGGS
ncbi:hypothetical protein ACGF3C_28455 [Micromonospora sp. NPDC047762]|uniref:hypothetical protein n=1 Tax=unclassified Micromonospora TaxID=2617518 RepID=UPI0033DE2C05